MLAPASIHDDPSARTVSPAVQAQIDDIYARRDRAQMQPTIDAFSVLLAEDPQHAVLQYELAGAYDTAGREAEALTGYEQALQNGLPGDVLRRCLLQYGSTLRNLERFDDSVAVLARARELFPQSPSVRAFLALSLHAAGRSDAAVAEYLLLTADFVAGSDIERYHAALRGNAEYLHGLDAGGSDGGA